MYKMIYKWVGNKLEMNVYVMSNKKNLILNVDLYYYGEL